MESWICTLHLIKHLTMLASNTNDGFEIFRIFLELLYKGTHLNGLWAGSEYKHYGFHILISLENISSINFVLYIVQSRVIAVSYDSLTLCLEGVEVINDF